MLDFKKGAFHVALDAKMAILPIVISEYDNILGPPKEEKFQGGEVIGYNHQNFTFLKFH